MRTSLLRIKGLGFLLWHARHEFYHVLLGLMWAWFLRERWGEFNLNWIAVSIFGSLLPDLDHFIYFVGYGRYEQYAQQVRNLLKGREWRNLFLFMEHGHKKNTNTFTHNFYFMGILLTTALLSSFVDWEVGVILFGAMLIHYLFDIADDMLLLGHLNANWRRWGRERK